MRWVIGTKVKRLRDRRGGSSRRSFGTYWRMITLALMGDVMLGRKVAEALVATECVPRSRGAT